VSNTDSTAVIETRHPNAATIQGLREAADWLEQHPELPEACYTSIALRSSYNRRESAREELTAMAAALGARAIEKPGASPGEITIEGGFRAVRVYGSAHIQDLRDEAPPVVEYEPIIPVGVAA
jgi:hypothetical protein